MKLEDHTLNLSFSIGNVGFRLQRIVLESVERPIPLHSHGSGCFEFHYILSGSGSILSDGTEYPAASNVFYVTGPLIPHAQASDPNAVMEEYCLYLKVTEKQQSLPWVPQELKDFLAQLNNARSCFLPQAPGLGRLMTAVFAESSRKDPGYTIQIESLFKEILVQLIRSLRNESAQEAKKSTSLPPDKALLLIDEAFLYGYRDLTLNDLAAQLNLSQRQTERLLKQYYGKTFQQKKADARMAAAVILLKKDTSITQIAEALGYSSIEHFSSSFKKYYGFSPTVYRKQERKTRPPAQRKTPGQPVGPDQPDCLCAQDNP